jgi:hypothetical protein
MGHDGVQVLRCRVSGGRLGSMLLSLAQLGDGGSERNEVRHQRRSQQGGITGEITGHGQQPRLVRRRSPSRLRRGTRPRGARAARS